MSHHHEPPDGLGGTGLALWREMTDGVTYDDPSELERCAKHARSPRPPKSWRRFSMGNRSWSQDRADRTRRTLSSPSCA